MYNFAILNFIKMMRIKKWILLCICSLGLFNISNGQDTLRKEREYQMRYWKYRDRFTTYFIHHGQQPGDGFVCGRRNEDNGTGMKFGQHGIYLGYWMGVLATEYRLAKNSGMDTCYLEQVRDEISETLNTYEYMDNCEEQWGKPDKVDGFFVRERVPSDYLTTSFYAPMYKADLNRGLTPFHVFDTAIGAFAGLEKGQPGWVDVVLVNPQGAKESMSQDEAYGVMMGLALIVKCVDDEQIVSRAKDYTDKIAKHILTIGTDCRRNYYTSPIFTILDPDCKPVRAGSSTYALAFGIAYAASAVTGKPFDDYRWKDQPKAMGVQTLWAELRHSINNKVFPNAMPEYNHAMIATLAALGDGWGKNTEQGLIYNTYRPGGDKPFDWRSFYLTLWRFLQDKPQNQEEKELIEAELSSAPPHGPYRYSNTNYAPGGWAYLYRYRATFAEQAGQHYFSGNFNGADYMLMHNLYRLVYLDGKYDLTKN